MSCHAWTFCDQIKINDITWNVTFRVPETTSYNDDPDEKPYYEIISPNQHKTENESIHQYLIRIKKVDVWNIYGGYDSIGNYYEIPCQYEEVILLETKLIEAASKLDKVKWEWDT
jgi:hypothetical protein